MKRSGLAVLLLGMASLAAFSQTGTSVPELAVLDEIMQRALARHGIPGGALAVAKHGHLVFARGYGLADVEAGEPVEPESLFRWESISKTVTAAAVMRLVDEGKLDLDTPVFHILNQYSPYNGRLGDSRLANITVRQLLQHTGGWDRITSTLGDPVDGDGTVKVARAVGGAFPPSIDTVIRYMLAQRLDFGPGQRYGYSPFGYELLGRVIEKASGQPYRTFVRENLLDPLGLPGVQLGNATLAGRLPGEVRYYENFPGAPWIPSYVSAAREMEPRPYAVQDFNLTDSAGAWVGSAIDIVKLASMLDGTRPAAPIGAGAFRTMLEQSQPPTWVNANAWYGLGLVVWPESAGLVWSHGGYNPGAQTYFFRWPNGFCFAYLFNGTGPDSDPVAASSEVAPEIWNALLALDLWPEHDLFPQYYGPRIRESGVVNAASYEAGGLAPGSLFSILGTDLGGKDADVSVYVRDANSVERAVPVLYSGPHQINAIVPDETGLGDTSVVVRRAGWPDAVASFPVTPVGPAIFTVNASGLAAASLVRSRGGRQAWEHVFQMDATGNLVPRPIQFQGEDETLSLVLYGTGIRRATAGARVRIGETDLGASYTGAQTQYAGLDQINVDLPRSLAGAGDVAVQTVVDGRTSNAVHLTFD